MMEILERYLKAVSGKLPWRSRKDIVDELRSLMLDQIEESYGDNPTEEDLNAYLKDYGSPDKTAAEYRGNHPIIAAGLSDLYKLIILIMAGAMLIAFTVVGIIEMLEIAPVGSALVLRILQIPLEAFSGWLAGVGTVTLIFMVMSRVMKKPELDLNEDWKVEDLKHVELRPTESVFESILTIGFLSLLIVLLNVYPEIVSLAERLFSKSGLGPHHLLVVERFRFYVLLLSAIWLGGILTRVAILRSGEKGTKLQAGEAILSVLEVAVNSAMLLDESLFTPVGSGGWIGLKVVIAITLLVNIAELIGFTYRFIRRRVTEA